MMTINTCIHLIGLDGQCCYFNDNKYSQTLLSWTGWDYILKLRDIQVFKILRVKYFKNKWLGLKNHCNISFVFEISVFEIPKFNCKLYTQEQSTKLHCVCINTEQSIIKHLALKMTNF